MAAALLCMACTSSTIDTSAPVATESSVEAVPLPALPLSVIDAPIGIALEPAREALEQAIPREFGDIERRIQNPGNNRQHFAFAASRSPFRYRLRGQRLTLETVITYQGRGWYDPPLAPAVSASCGTGDQQPRLKVVVSTRLDLTEQWRLATRTTLDTIAPFSDSTRDECRVTLFAIDVTGRVVNTVGGLLQRNLPKVDQRLRQVNIRNSLEHWYNLLNKQYRVGDSMWLVFHPDAVHLGEVTANDSAIVADIRLFARPVIYSGEEPARVVTPLPPMTRATRRVGDTLRVLVDGRLDYEVASAKLQQALGGRRFTRFGRSVRIDSVRLFGLGDGRIALALAVGGAVRGTAYLVGTPQLDREHQLLTVPDLEFDVATQSALVRSLAWMTRRDVVDELRERARFPLTDALDRVRERVEETINRDLAAGVRLSAQLRTGELIEVVAMKHELLIRSEITGALGLFIDRPLRVRITP